MKIRALCILLFIFCSSLFVKALPFQSYDKSAFYSAMKTGEVEEINTQLSLLDNCSIPEKQAYQGTLLMKKAGLVKKPKDKLDYFKQGRIKLETAILNDSTNAEYRFLRLTIEEHAPKIVKYKGQLEEDKQFIKSHFKSLSPLVQQAVLDYSKSSTILHPEDF